jgi:hypothetical protein
MVVKLREQLEQAPPESQAPDVPRRKGGPMLWVAAAVALLAVVVGIGIVVLSTGETGTPEPAVEAATGEELVCQLAARGQLPPEACPTASGVLQPAAPIYTDSELETMRLVDEGRLPEAALESQSWLIKRLANEGQIPREAATADDALVAPRQVERSGRVDATAGFVAQ